MERLSTRNRSSGLMEEAGRALAVRLLMAAGMMFLTACRSTPPPTVTKAPSARSTASLEPRASPTVSKPPQTPRPTSTVTVPKTPSPTASATPADRPPPSYDQALRPAFRSDDDRFPNATRYRLDLTLDLEEATLTGSQHISYTNTETVPLSALYLRAFPNTAGYGGDMRITTLALEGRTVELERVLQNSALRVPFEEPLVPGDGVNLDLDFVLVLPMEGLREKGEEGGVSGGYRQLGIYDGVTALANAYPIIPVYDRDEGWNVELAPSYGDAVFSDVAFFDVSITAPTGMTLTGSGTCTAAKTDPDDTTWSCIAAPMRDFNAVLGEDYEVKNQDVDGIAVNSVFYSGQAEGGQAALDYASRAVRLFNRRIGPYPFAELDVIETPTLAGGVEYPALVVINESYYRSTGESGDRMEWVVVHEVLHQWWYSIVGNDQVDDPWLDEALVQYCTLLYYEEEYGEKTAERLVERLFQQSYERLLETGRDQPAGLPVASYSRDNYGPVVYQKGPLYFHHLRQEVGRETFYEILQAYYRRNRYRVARPQDWLAAVKAVTGSDYRSLYDRWIQEPEG